MSAGTTIQIRARVPVIVKVDDQKIFCNSTAGYILYAIDLEGNKREVETYKGATIKDNTFTKTPDESWLIEAL